LASFFLYYNIKSIKKFKDRYMLGTPKALNTNLYKLSTIYL